MASFLGKLFGGDKGSEPSVPSDQDFAFFAQGPDRPPLGATPGGAAANLFGGGGGVSHVPFSKWYNVHERHSWSDFRHEGVILAISAVVLLLHLVGARRNRTKAQAWMRAHAAVLQDEFATVGFGAPAAAAAVPLQLRENSLFEFATYATGRQNVAFLDVELGLVKRFNPVVSVAEAVLGYLIDAAPTPEDAMVATLYPFDGRETLLVPAAAATAAAAELEAKSSTYDAFVFAVVNKDRMQRLREARYDVSLTTPKDHQKLPPWLTVMSENAEVTEQLLTPELLEAVRTAGTLFDHLIISDQPVDKPTTIEEVVSRKRLLLRYRLPADNRYDQLLPLFSYFLRLPDLLVDKARFRPEVTRKLRGVRDELVAQIRRDEGAEKAAEKAADRDKAKKAKRDQELNGLDVKAQKKYLEKEREKEARRSQKRIRA